MFPVHYFLVIGLSQTAVEVCGVCFQSTIFWLYVSHRLLSRFVGCVSSPLFSGYTSLTDCCRGLWGVFPVHYFLVIGLSQTAVEVCGMCFQSTIFWLYVSHRLVKVCGMCFQSTIFWLYVSHRLLSRFVGCVFSPLFSGYRTLTDCCRGLWDVFPVHYFLVIGLSQTHVEVCGVCFQSTIFWLYVSRSRHTCSCPWAAPFETLCRIAVLRDTDAPDPQCIEITYVP